MTGINAPGKVRLASRLTWATAGAGLLLIVAGSIELYWWGTPDSAQLTALLADIARQDGPPPPPLLRGQRGAVDLIVVGVACLALASLAPLLAQGRLWARTAAFIATPALFLYGLVGLGGDVMSSPDFPGYFKAMVQARLGDLVPQVKSLLYPGWYSWLEDIAQGVQVGLSLACLIALITATVLHADYFTTKKTDRSGPDEWAEAFSRLHQRTVGAAGPDGTGTGGSIRGTQSDTRSRSTSP
ncbi:hypothetical protein [Plantactinospora sp. GCM10030261]|uniref:hypothetical protein n=1 Tax=Plantactinospora sp. GCM10030261 TaxID=3273420 RepID=UPI003618F0A4